MQRAIELARQGMTAGDGGPFGAVIVRRGEIVGEGWNRVLADGDPTAHGEITAIRDACRRLGTYCLAGCDLYTTGEPCPMCLGAVYWARIERVYFGFSVAEAAAAGFDDVVIYREICLPRERRKVSCLAMPSDEVRTLMKEFSRLPDRARY
jgi:tRNA(Arg) A34 adenosine deaminase TadA